MKALDRDVILACDAKCKALEKERDEARAALAKAEGELNDAYVFLEAGAATKEIAARMRTQPIVVWLKVAVNTIDGQQAALAKAQEELAHWKMHEDPCHGLGCGHCSECVGVARAQLAVERAVAMEECARLVLDLDVNYEDDAISANVAAAEIRALAPLPSTLVAVDKKKLETLRALARGLYPGIQDQPSVENMLFLLDAALGAGK